MKCSLLGAAMLVCVSSAADAQYENVDERLLGCVAHVVYGESRNEPLMGQYSVAWSVIFRAMANVAYFGGSDLCDIVYKTRLLANGDVRWEYDGAKIPVTDVRAWEAALDVAYWTLLGYGKPDRPVTYFCAPYACRWHNSSKKLDYVGTIGGHQFYVDWGLPASSDVVEASGE